MYIYLLYTILSIYLCEMERVRKIGDKYPITQVVVEEQWQCLASCHRKHRLRPVMCAPSSAFNVTPPKLT